MAQVLFINAEITKVDIFLILDREKLFLVCFVEIIYDFSFIE